MRSQAEPTNVCQDGGPWFCNGIEDLGGQGPILHLAHANGFPPGAYRLLARELADNHRVVGLPLRPLWPGCPPSSITTWRPLADDMIRALDALGWHGVAGVGHSLGGVVTMWAAIQRPDLFRAVVLVEPVILPVRLLAVVRLLRLLGMAEWQPFVRGALRRRREWPSREACFAHLRDKSLFAEWSDEALQAYVERATRERADGTIQLVYPREWEAHIFATLPVDIWRDVPLLNVPTLLVRGESSTTFPPDSLRRLARLLPGSELAVVSGAGHLVPMERPEVLGRIIEEFLIDRCAD